MSETRRRSVEAVPVVAPSDADIRVADAGYRPFPRFSEWAAATLDSIRWSRYVAELRERSASVPVAVRQNAVDLAMRAAAIDTGALEGLYDVDRGFTLSIAGKAEGWEARLQAKGTEAVRFMEAQIRAYQSVADLAAENTPLSEASIRTLHAELCAGQEKYTVMTAVGWQEQPLPRGVYKRYPNHVITSTGALHAYAPVQSTPMEMERLFRELRDNSFQTAHPILQAAYAHYALVVIHPFADGNGRVARALSSVFLYRAASVPLLVFAEQRDSYLDALRATDGGDFQAFVSFVQERVLDAIRLVEESLAVASSTPLEGSIEAWKALQLTRSGHTPAEVDLAGHALFGLFHDALETAVAQLRKRAVVPDVELTTQRRVREAGALRSYRIPAGDAGNVVDIVFRASGPVPEGVRRKFQIQVPIDPSGDDDLVMAEIDGETGLALDDPARTVFGARLGEVFPRPGAALEARATMRAGVIVAETLEQLTTKIAKRLGRA
jgi:Fic family protein